MLLISQRPTPTHGPNTEDPNPDAFETKAYRRFDELDKDDDGFLNEYELRQFALWMFAEYRDDKNMPMSQDAVNEQVESLTGLIEESGKAHEWGRVAVGFVEFERYFRSHNLRQKQLHAKKELVRNKAYVALPKGKGPK